MSNVADAEAPRVERRDRDPVRAAEAARALVESIRTVAEEDDTLIADMIEGETDLFEIMDRLIGRINENTAYARGLDAQIGDLKGRQERFERRVATDRTLIEQAMMIADLAKIERPGATLSLANRGPKVVIETEADIPAEFWRPGAPTLDKKALGAALKDGRAVAGARLDNSAPTLTIRIK